MKVVHCRLPKKEKGKVKVSKLNNTITIQISSATLLIFQFRVSFIVHFVSCSSHHLSYYVLSVDGWSRTSHPCTRNEFGVWELTIPYKEDGSSPIPHGSKVKVSVVK